MTTGLGAGFGVCGVLLVSFGPVRGIGGPFGLTAGLLVSPGALGGDLLQGPALWQGLALFSRCGWLKLGRAVGSGRRLAGDSGMKLGEEGSQSGIVCVQP